MAAEDKPAAWRGKGGVTPRKSFRVDPATWDQFVARCHDQGRSATDVLLELIANWMRKKKP